MKLSSFINLDEGRVVSIVGAGGKTSLMFALARELGGKSKVLVTTTTKIYVPKEDECDYIETLDKEFHIANGNKNDGIYVYGNSIDAENKLIGFDAEYINKFVPFFDYILIEADGSRKKPVKGWKDYEPVISSCTEKTIGVLSAEIIGKLVDEHNVHNLREFMDITNTVMNERITSENICSLIFHSKGLFKNAKGERILFVNKVEESIDENTVNDLLESIKKGNKKYIDAVIFGSLKNKNYKKYV